MTLQYCPLWIVFFAWLFSLAGTALTLPLLKRLGVMDTPLARSNHKISVPRGGGIMMIITILLFFWSLGVGMEMLLAAALLMAVSFTDDLKSLSVRWRLLAQLIAVALAMHSLPGRLLPDAIPYFIEWGFIALFWLWFINLTNFMDGIDGITSMQMIAMALGICLVYSPLGPPAAVLAAAVLGFFWFNRPPAKLFMGDAGSIPLGFLMFYLLLSLAIAGARCAALILPAYYLSDATLTLLKRLLRGEKVWQAHSEHAYQRAVRGGMTHKQVVRRITGLNMILVVLAMSSTVSMMAGIATLLVAYALTFCFIRYLAHAPAAH